MFGVETRNNFEQSVKVEGEGALKSNLRTWAPFDFRSPQRGSVMGEEVQRTSWEAGRRLCSRIEERTAEPSLPVTEVKANILGGLVGFGLGDERLIE